MTVKRETGDRARDALRQQNPQHFAQQGPAESQGSASADAMQDDPRAQLPSGFAAAIGFDGTSRLQGLADPTRAVRAGAGAEQIARNLGAVAEGRLLAVTLGAAVGGMVLASLLLMAPAAQAQSALNLNLPRAPVVNHDLGLAPIAMGIGGDRIEVVERALATGRSTVFNHQLDAIKKRDTTSVDDATRRAFERFEVGLARALRFDASGAALGGPASLGAGMSRDETRLMREAIRGLMSEMPIGAFAPEVAKHVRELLHEQGVVVEDFETRRVKDLREPGKAVVMKLLDEFHTDHPATVYGLGVAIAGAVGMSSYLKGSDVLHKLGLKPELKKGFLNDKLTARVGLDWEERFTQPKITTRLEHRDGVNLFGVPMVSTVGVGVVARGPTFKDIHVSGLELSGSLSGTLANGGALALSVGAVGTPKGLDQMALSGVYARDQLTVGVGVTRFGSAVFAQDERTVGSLSVGYKVNKRVQLAAEGRYDSRTGSYAGVGMTISLD